MGHISIWRERRRDRWPVGGPISWIAIAAATVILAGCMTLGHVAAVPAIAEVTVLVPRAAGADHPNAPGTRGLPRLMPGEPRVALALGGGSLRGIAHIGVLAEMERAGMRPSLVVGSSAGSLVGALWAAGLTAGDIEHASRELDWTVLLDLGVPRRGFVRGDRIEDFVRRHVGDATIESMPNAFAAVATDMRTGEAVVLDAGNAAAAVRASSGIPVLFEPVRSQGRLLVDGSLAAPTPVRAARHLGADLVIAVNVAWAPNEAILDNPADMLFQTLQVMAHNLNREELAHADVVIAPDIRRLGAVTTDSRDALVEVGREAARTAMLAIQEAVRAWRMQRGLLTAARN